MPLLSKVSYIFGASLLGQIKKGLLDVYICGEYSNDVNDKGHGQ